MAQRSGFYLFSPLFLIYIPFITGDILPAITYAQGNILPENVEYVIISTVVVYSIFLIVYYKQMMATISIEFPDRKSVV
jgi:hypothetical protein